MSCRCDGPLVGFEGRRKERVKDVLEKMAQAEAIARGLGVPPFEIDRLKREVLEELSSHLMG